MAATLEVDPQRIRHAVQLYADDGELARSVGTYLGSALQGGDPAIVIATPAHLAAFEAALTRLGFDPAAVREGGLLRTFHAEGTLASFMVDGHPDADAFDAVIGALVRTAGGAGRRPVAYGEMVSILWADGNVVAALELEALWNDLLDREEFSLLCAYPASIVGEATAQAFDAICGAHSDIVGVPAAAPVPGGPLGLVERRGFPRALRSPGVARRFAAETLERWGETALAADAAVVVSELANNAVLHAESGFVVTITAPPHTLRIAVQDGSERGPRTVAPGSDDATSGRGLVLVRSLARAWGTDRVEGGGKVVWAELERPDRHAARD